MADEKIEKVAEIYQLYLADTLQFLTYMTEKSIAEKVEDAFQEQRRRARKGK